MFHAFRTWDKVISASTGRPVAVGDALGMLYGAVEFRSQDPVINKVFMEMALLVAPRVSTLEAVHVWSEENVIADTLSRMGTDEKWDLPILLTKVPRTPMCDAPLRILPVR